MSATLRQSLTAIEVARVSAGWVDGPEVHVVATAADLPVAAPSDARGLFWGRSVYVVARQPSAMVAPTLAHEATHFALRDTLSPSLWRRFMLAVRKAARKGRDTYLRRLNRQVESIYVDGAGRRTLRPAAVGDEIVAALAEETFDRRTGRFLVHDPLLAEADAAIGMIAREVLRVDYEVDARQVQGAILLAEHRLRYGGLGFGAWYWTKRIAQWAAITAGLLGFWLLF
jgi:hypothetical protein